MSRNLITSIQIIYLSNILTMSLLNIYYQAKIEYTLNIFIFSLIEILDLGYKDIAKVEIKIGVFMYNIFNLLLLSQYYYKKYDHEVIDYAVLQYIPYILLLLRNIIDIKVVKDLLKVIIWCIYPIFVVIIPYYALIVNYRNMNNSYTDKNIVFFSTMIYYFNINWTLVKYKVTNIVVNVSIFVLILFNYFIVNEEIYYTNNILLIVTHILNLELNNRYTKTLSTMIIQKTMLSMLLYDIKDVHHSNNDLINIISTILGFVKYNNINRGYDTLLYTVLFFIASSSIIKKVITIIIMVLSYQVSYISNDRTLFDVSFFLNLIIFCRNSQNKIEL